MLIVCKMCLAKLLLLVSIFYVASGQLVSEIPYDIFVDNYSQNFSKLEDALQYADQSLLALQNKYHVPSVASAISIKGKTIWEKTSGQIDLENHVPSSLHSKYRLCSISKTFTSALIGQLVEKGLLNYSTPVNDILNVNDFPVKTWKNQTVKITISQLLSHTAGTHSSLDQDFDNVMVAQNCTGSLHQYKNEKLNFEPGTGYLYSNYGFQLLGAVIEALTYKPYQKVITEFFHHHQMNSSFVETEELMLDDRAHYYEAENGNLSNNRPAAVWDEIFIKAAGYWSSGGLLSTVDDLIHYGQLMIDSYKGRSNAILTPNTIRQMWSPQIDKVNSDHSFSYGYGWTMVDLKPSQHHSTIRDHKLYYHAGGLFGTTAMFVIYPEEEIVGVFLTNKGNVPGLRQFLMQTVDNIHPFV